ncbi:MAG: hypothetical protein M3619_16470, partial [Myxococcota bacterium]|nr:hypothetical protein [Myxococcota bacterium]
VAQFFPVFGSGPRSAPVFFQIAVPVALPVPTWRESAAMPARRVSRLPWIAVSLACAMAGVIVALASL